MQPRRRAPDRAGSYTWSYTGVSEGFTEERDLIGFSFLGNVTLAAEWRQECDGKAGLRDMVKKVAAGIR